MNQSIVSTSFRTRRAALVSTWLAPFLFLIASRLLLTGLALAAVNLLPLSPTLYTQDPVSLDPHSLPGVWTRYDAGYYMNIAVQGYSSGGKDTNFFPGYPLLLSLGGRSLLAAGWMGWAISNLAFVLAGLLLFGCVRSEFGRPVAWAALAAQCVFPTAFFFSAVYTESLFLLLSVLVYLLSRQRRYALAGLVVSAASLTRVTGFVLAIIPLVELLLEKPPAFWRKLATTALLSGLGAAGILIFNWLRYGSPLAFIFSQSATMGRYVTFPWVTLADSLGVLVSGQGGYEQNWFMRLVSLQDLCALLFFMALTGLAFAWLRKSLAWYLLAGVLVVLVSHGPSLLGVYSGARYVLPLFPGFIVMGLLLQKMGRWKWAAWAVSTLMLVILTAWWVTGHWVA